MLQQLYREANAKPATLVSPPLGDPTAFLTESTYSRSRDKRKKRTLMAGMAFTRVRSALWTHYSRSDGLATEVSVPRSQLRTIEHFVMYLSLVCISTVAQSSRLTSFHSRLDMTSSGGSPRLLSLPSLLSPKMLLPLSRCNFRCLVTTRWQPR